MAAENRLEVADDLGVNADNPWPGLVSFSEKERDYFHGRVEEADELFSRVVRKNLTVLFGQSGLGKSSLLKAGLFPALRREGYLPIPIRLDHSPTAVSLSEQVIVATIRAIRQSGGQCDSKLPNADDSLWSHFHRRGFYPKTADGRTIRLVLVFDQFEELFAVGQSSEEARERASRFVRDFADLIENRVPRLLEQQMDENLELAKQFVMHDQDHRYLICLREDYLPHLESLRSTIPSLSENRMRLTRMTGDNALRAVVNPGSHLISEEVGRDVVNFVSGGRVSHLDGSSANSSDGLSDLEVEPSLLSLVCRELNNRRKASGLARITADLLAGSRERILQDFYERCVADQPSAVREFVEDQLVTDSGLRENIALERALKILAQRDVPASVIDQLVSRRLVHVEERLDVQRVELTHDVLTTVIKKSRDERHALEASLRAEQEAAKVLAKARQQRRRLRIIVGGMAAALAVVSAFGLASYRLYRVSEDRLLEVQRQKERAAAGEKAAESARKEAEVVKEVFDAATMPVTEENVHHVPGLGPVQEELARLRIQSLELLAAKTPEDDSIQPKLAQAYAVLGLIRTYVGSFKAAEADLKLAAELYATLSKANPDSLEFRLGELRALNSLGFLNWDDNRKPAARRYYEALIERLELELSQFPDNADVQFEMALALIRYGGSLPDNVSLEKKKSIAQRANDLGTNLVSARYRPGESERVLRVAAYRLMALKSSESTVEQRLADIDNLASLEQDSLKMIPDSPILQSYSYFTRKDRSEALVQIQKYDEALQQMQLAADELREVYRKSPNAYRYSDLLAECLKVLGNSYRRNQRFAEAKQALEESNNLSDQIVDRFPDRGFAISQWFDYRNEVAGLYEYSTHPAGPIKAREELLRTLDSTIAKGRPLAKTFSDHYTTQLNFAKILAARGRFAQEAKNPSEAYSYYREAVDIYVTRVFAEFDGARHDVDNWDIDSFMNYAAEAIVLAKEINDEEAVQQLVELGGSKRAQCVNRAGFDDLGRIYHVAAEMYSSKRRFTESIAMCNKAIEVRSSVYRDAPWHWYIETNLGSSYKLLAECHRELGDFKQEVLANREYLRIIIGPRYGSKIDSSVDPSVEANETEADKIREVISTALKSGMKRFTVPCDFAGIKYPFHVYVTNMPYPNHPLEKQARWLKEERGGIVPQEVMDSFARLQKIAHENNVSFVDLCVYALGTVEKEAAGSELVKDNEIDDGSRCELDFYVKGESVSAESVTDASSEKNVLDGLVSQLVVTRNLLANEPNRVSLIQKAASQYTDFGVKMLESGQAGSSIEPFAEALQLRELLANRFPTDVSRLQVVADLLRLLGKAFFQANRLDESYACIRRQSDLLEQIDQFNSSANSKMAIVECDLIVGEIAEGRNAGVEAMRWYHLAATNKHPRAYRKIAHLLRVAPKLVAFLTPAEREAYNRLKSIHSVDSPEFVEEFHTELTKERDAVSAQESNQSGPEAEEYNRYKQQRGLAVNAFRAQRYTDALDIFLTLCESKHANSNDFNYLGMCHGKLEQWDEAIRAYVMSIKLDDYSKECESTVLNLLEACICNNQPQVLLRSLESLRSKGFRIPEKEFRFRVFLYAFVAIAETILDKDPSEAIGQMRLAISKAEAIEEGWSWVEISGWLAKAPLNSAKKKAVVAIIDEIRSRPIDSQSSEPTGNDGTR